jgi:hypothetical protein
VPIRESKQRDHNLLFPWPEIRRLMTVAGVNLIWDVQSLPSSTTSSSDRSQSAQHSGAAAAFATIASP